MELTLVEWQKMSPDGLVYPWWSHPFLNELEKWDLRDKTWLEFGAGLGTAWLRKKCKWVDSIEANLEWAVKAERLCEANDLGNGVIHAKQIADGVQGNQQSYFGLIPENTQYDIISIDGIFRTEAIQWVIDHFRGREGILIADNFNQDYVWISPAAEEMVNPYEEHIFIQPNHVVHEGRPWNTRYWIIK